MGFARIAGLGTAAPTLVHQDALAGFYEQQHEGRQRALSRRIFDSVGVRTRHQVVSPLSEDVAGWSTAQRMLRYQAEAIPLGQAATDRAIADAGLSASDIGLFVVCSCTGYATPGLDIIIARNLGMSPTVQRLFVGHMGCYAALPGMGAAADYVTAQHRPAVLLCAELNSLHAQPPSARLDSEQVVAHALFGDAAAAVVFVSGDDSDGYALRRLSARTDTTAIEHLTWQVGDHGFRLGLSPQVPAALAAHLRPFVDELLGSQKLGISDIDGWAVHPGGPRILDVAQDELGLADEALEASRAVLSAYGNCSSPTVLLILDELRRSGRSPDRVVVLAFGPGLTLYGAVLEAGDRLPSSSYNRSASASGYGHHRQPRAALRG